jgi:hypothetical protein
MCHLLIDKDLCEAEMSHYHELNLLFVFMTFAEIFSQLTYKSKSLFISIFVNEL